MDKPSIVSPCPRCSRVIWTNAPCPACDKPAKVVPKIDPPAKVIGHYKPKTRDRGRH